MSSLPPHVGVYCFAQLVHLLYHLTLLSILPIIVSYSALSYLRPLSQSAMSMKILFTPSQTGSSDAVPLAYTGNPFHLLWSDVVLFFKHIKNVPGIILPAYPWPSKQLDEMYPSLMNIWTLALHTFLVIYQLLFIISIPCFALLWIPLPLFVVYCTVVFAFNKAVSWLLNGSAPFVDSKVDLSHDPKHDNESWVFLNGVAAGFVFTQTPSLKPPSPHN